MDFGGNESRLLLKLMSVCNLRQRVLADNIANESTPGFKRRVVRFEELLGKELDDAMSGSTSGNLARIEPRVEFDPTPPAGTDGNNVNLEAENTAMRENRMLYEAYAAILETRSNLLKASITESR
ncbi:MAG: flagellar basal body rod protein FlgB [Planctomycetes bacterium]|nr:flagellar basal body rod protein FlgB [Planctomycetota bacterium]